MIARHCKSVSSHWVSLLCNMYSQLQYTVTGSFESPIIIIISMLMYTRLSWPHSGYIYSLITIEPCNLDGRIRLA